jgi:uncharacterized membrane protein YfcA
VLATILYTLISGIKAHHGHGVLNWHIWKSMTPGILIGTGPGTCIATSLKGAVLKSFYILFLLDTSTQMLLKSKTKPFSWRLPGRGGIGLAGSVIGAVSSLDGIGGGTLFGVRFSHQLPVNRLKHSFGILLYILALKMTPG